MRQERNHAHLRQALRNENGFRTRRGSCAKAMGRERAGRGWRPGPARTDSDSGQPSRLPSYSSEPHKANKYKDNWHAGKSDFGHSDPGRCCALQATGSFSPDLPSILKSWG